MTVSLRIGFAVLAFVAAPAASAAPDATASREIDHLLAFVAASPCRFVRAGSEHPGPEARDHLQRKLGAARSMLSTADQFIDYVATGSSLTGEAYKVRCGSRELTSKEWLHGELDQYRKAAKTK
ncbi:MAG TPA: DUF5329 domain-containing protein [Casimicrobiaceae bacterium]|nr:DUF5329 domain-containing protein [Casimicrobiaceae bacterium]